MLIATGLVISLFANAAAKAADDPAVPLPPAPEVQTPPTETAPPPEAGEVQERGLGQLPQGGQLQQQLQMVGPTPNLTAVANALQLKSKSLTTVITVPANLPLTQPVTINIWYSSPAGSDTPSRGQPYNPSNGNRFVHHDPEGDGKPRQLRMDVSLLEANPAGGFHRFSFSKQVNLDPLYDVTISPMRFGLLTTCDTLGDIFHLNSEILFYWYDPMGGQYHSVKFNAKVGQVERQGPEWVTINGFAWTQAEVSASHNRHRPTHWFLDFDSIGLAHNFPKPNNLNLVPGKTQTAAYLASNLRQETVSHEELAYNATGTPIGPQCKAHLQYTIKYLLRQYPDL